MTESATTSFGGPWWRYALLRNALVAGVIAGVGLLLGHFAGIGWPAERLFYMVAIPLGGYHWAREAVEELVRDQEVGIDLLMLAAAIGSCVLGLWDEAAFLAFLYGAAEGLEEYTYARTRAAIRALLDLAPKEARVLRDGTEISVPAEQLRPGDRFVVRPGEAIATDGVIRAGRSSIDESAVTGESVPVDKGPDMPVFAGTMNRQGALEIEATAAFIDNTLSKIVHLVEEAQEQKGRTQQWIKRFGARYSSAVLIAALGMIVVPWLVGAPLEAWAVRAVVLLVAAAPCALVMSTPVAIAAGISHAGKHGVLIKGGVHLEHLGTVRCVAFDKTGTLTEGHPAVADVVPLTGTPEELVAVAAAVEHFSEHPLARTIVDHAQGSGIAFPAARDFQALTGLGARAVVDGRTWMVGNPDLFVSRGVALNVLQSHIDQLQGAGKTVVLVGNDEGIIGILALQDRVRSEARATVKWLQRSGIEVVMLTGDHARTAEAVARRLQIGEVHASLKPEDKVRVVRELAERFHEVLMVGDGVNDAPALAAATCSVAMGAIGTDAAIEAADVALMADDLSKLIDAIQLGRRARQISRQNIAFSLTLLFVLIPAAVLGVLSITAAVLLHETSELLAVANGLRVGRCR